jgi:hypothetical protein
MQLCLVIRVNICFYRRPDRQGIVRHGRYQVNPGLNYGRRQAPPAASLSLISKSCADHGFDGIDNQIENDLVQLDSISSNERHVIRELRLDGNTIF